MFQFPEQINPINQKLILLKPFPLNCRLNQNPFFSKESINLKYQTNLINSNLDNTQNKSTTTIYTKFLLTASNITIRTQKLRLYSFCSLIDPNKQKFLIQNSSSKIHHQSVMKGCLTARSRLIWAQWWWLQKNRRRRKYQGQPRRMFYLIKLNLYRVEEEESGCGCFFRSRM